MKITSRGPTVHGVECFEAWRAERDCPHERSTPPLCFCRDHCGSEPCKSRTFRNTKSSTQPKESTMQTSDYVVTASPRAGTVARYHRAKCSKIKPEQVVDSGQLAEAKPCSSCQPPAPVIEVAEVEQLKGCPACGRTDVVRSNGMIGAHSCEAISGRAAKAEAKRTTRAAATAKAGPAVRLFHDGKPMPDSQNKLSSVAYYHTRDVGHVAARVSTGDLRAILAKAGIDDPEHTAWTHELPNGVTLSAVVESDAAAVAS